MSTEKRQTLAAASTTDSHRSPERLFPPTQESSEIMMACRRDDYSASAIARAVEDCDAHLLNLNVTGDASPDGTDSLIIELRVSHRNAMGVARSLERYGYRVLLTRHGSGRAESDPRVDEAVERVRGLLAQLEV